jgi:hypothetical protein
MEMRNQAALTLLLVSIIADLGLPFLLGRRVSGYSQLKDPISALAETGRPGARIESINLFCIGVLLLLFSIVQWNQFTIDIWSARIYKYSIVLYAIGGCILAGIFPVDSKNSNKSISGLIHGISSVIGFVVLQLCPLWATFNPQLSAIWFYNLLLFVLAIFSFGLFIVSEHNGKGALQYTGLFQRCNLLILYGCLLSNFLFLISPGTNV